MAGRILIADNVATNRIILKVKLAASSYEVWQVDEGDALLSCARRDMPDLILLDAGLDGPGSFELCRKLKADPQTKSIPIIMVSADYGSEVRLLALQSGADEVLPKPVEDQVLLARVRNLLRVASTEKELLSREGTAMELGFNETPSTFAPQIQILFVTGHQAPPTHLLTLVETEIAGRATCVSDDHVLAHIRNAGRGPDIIILPPEVASGVAGLTLVAELRSRPETRHAAIIVTHAAEDLIGAVAALDIGANDLLDTASTDAELLLRIGTQLARKRKTDRLRETLEDGLRLAVTDPLTGLFNRRYALPHMARIAMRAEKTGEQFAVMVLDLDRFKRINDRFGHSAGDIVLKEVAGRLKRNLRSVDLISRIGGEEFLVVMPDTDLPQALAAAERLRRVTEAEPIELANRTPIIVTLSIGVSIGGLDGQNAVPVEKIVDSADQALLGAKSHGRNQVLLAQSAA